MAMKPRLTPVPRSHSPSLFCILRIIHDLVMTIFPSARLHRSQSTTTLASIVFYPSLLFIPTPSFALCWWTFGLDGRPPSLPSATMDHFSGAVRYLPRWSFSAFALGASRSTIHGVTTESRSLIDIILSPVLGFFVNPLHSFLALLSLYRHPPPLNLSFLTV